MVLDGGNGMAGPMVGPLLDRFPIEQIRTYWKPDGRFPDHEPNPLLEENRRFIIDKVREADADLGIAWDGDADRCFFIDDTGEFVAGDFLTALWRALCQEPGATVHTSSRFAGGGRIVDGHGATHGKRVARFFKTPARDGAAFGGRSRSLLLRDFTPDSGPAALLLSSCCP